MSGYKSVEHFATNAIHAGQDPGQWTSGALVPPISLSTTFVQETPGHNPAGYDYSRSSNPSRDVAERCVAALEDAKYGRLFSSGLAATNCITQLLECGDHVIVMDDLYGGVHRFFRDVATRSGIQCSFVDATDPRSVRDAIKSNTRMVWIESPTNPNMKIVDMKAVASIVKERSDILLVLDNTFSSCYFQRPLELGADIAFQSVTKYLNGHSDVVMGAVVTNSDVIGDKLLNLQNSVGSVPSAFDCFLLNRGLKTMALRMEQHQRSGLAVAMFLESNRRVERVLHPGLSSHPQYELAKSQMIGHSGMLSFYMRGGLDEVKVFLKSTKLVALAVSLGSYRSLAEHPATMSHASIGPEARHKYGINDNLIRLSCGLENTQDLIDDLEQALVKAVPKI